MVEHLPQVNFPRPHTRISHQMYHIHSQKQTTLNQNSNHNKKSVGKQKDIVKWFGEKFLKGNKKYTRPITATKPEQ